MFVDAVFVDVTPDDVDEVVTGVLGRFRAEGCGVATSRSLELLRFCLILEKIGLVPSHAFFVRTMNGKLVRSSSRGS